MSHQPCPHWDEGVFHINILTNCVALILTSTLINLTETSTKHGILS